MRSEYICLCLVYLTMPFELHKLYMNYGLEKTCKEAVAICHYRNIFFQGLRNSYGKDKSCTRSLGGDSGARHLEYGAGVSTATKPFTFEINCLHTD
jgi:hypothetical protein